MIDPTTDRSVQVKDLPVLVRLVIDALMLRSTVPTAIIYGVAWAGVVLFVAFALGVFARIGLTGYEARGEAAKVSQQVRWLVGNDVEYYYAVLCRMPDSIAREQVAEHYTRLQAEYKYISGGNEAPVQPCPSRTVQ